MKCMTEVKFKFFDAYSASGGEDGDGQGASCTNCLGLRGRVMVGKLGEA